MRPVPMIAARYAVWFGRWTAAKVGATWGSNGARLGPGGGSIAVLRDPRRAPVAGTPDLSDERQMTTSPMLTRVDYFISSANLALTASPQMS